MAFDDGVKTVSGSVAHTDDAATKVPFVSVKCGIEPTLSGVSAVSEKHTGRNIMTNNIADGTDWGITHTKNADGSITIDGEATARISLYYMNPANLPSNTAYTLSTSYDGDVSGYFIQVTVRRKSDDEVSARRQVRKSTQSLSFNVADSEYISDAFLRVENGGTADNCKIYAQLEYGSTAHAYEPYTTPTTYTASLGRTIYGGQVDIVNGTGTETYGVIDMGSLNWLIGTLNGAQQFYVLFPDAVKPSTSSVIADILVEDFTVKTADQVYLGTSENMIISLNAQGYLQVRDFDVSTASDFKTSVTGKKLVYKKATPTDFTFTPITPTPETVGKVNNVYCNTGDTELTYYDNAHGFAEVTVNKTGKNVRQNVADYSSANPVFFQYRNYYSGAKCGYPRLTGLFKAGTYTLSFDTDYSGFEANRVCAWAKKPNDDTYYNLSSNGDLVSPTQQGYQNWCSVSSGHVTGTFKINEDCESFGFGYYKYNTSVPYTNLMLEVGSMATTYAEPITPVSKTAYLHKVIYGGQANVVKGTCEPKNLLPMTNYDGGVYNPDVGRQLSLTVSQTQFEKTGGVYSVSTISSWKTFTVLFPIISGATYYEKWMLSVESGQQGSTRAYLDEDFKVLAKYNNNSSDPITTNGVMSPPTGAKYLAITWTNRGTAVQTLNITEPQIEKGTSASDFAPYFEPFSFPPISMSTDEGENTLFANEGSSAITYRKETD